MPAVLEPPKTKKPGKLFVHKLLSSTHIGIQEGWERPKDANGKPLFNDEHGQVIVPPKHKYVAGEPGNDIVRDRRNLSDPKLFGEKFQLISGDPAMSDAASHANDALVADNERLRLEGEYQRDRVAELEARLGLENTPSAEPGFDGMTKAQLVEYAATNEIDLGDARSKDDILAAVKQAAQ